MTAYYNATTGETVETPVRRETLQTLSDRIDDIRAAAAELEDAGDPDGEGLRLMLDGMLSGAEGDIAEKIGRGYLPFRREMLALARQSEAYSVRVMALAQRRASLARGMEERLACFLVAQDTDHFEGPDFRVDLCENGHSVEITERPNGLRMPTLPEPVPVVPIDLPSLFGKTSKADAIHAILEEIDAVEADAETAAAAIVNFLAGVDAQDKSAYDAAALLFIEYTARVDATKAQIAEIDNAVKAIQAEAAAAKALILSPVAPYAKRADLIRAALQERLVQTQTRKVDTGAHAITLTKNGGKAALRITEKIDDLPVQFRKEVPDAEKIRLALEEKAKFEAEARKAARQDPSVGPERTEAFGCELVRGVSVRII